jgi:4-nitrophenol 2-monooxygenase / 4-nitrocatechol 4-monooxygenase, reductase component
MSTPAVDVPHDLRRLTPEEFRDVIGSFASGVTVITALHEDKPHGTTASAVSSLSLEPPMILICLNKTSSTGRAVAGAGRFAVNILDEEQAHEAMRFATKGDDKFDGLAVASGKQGEPLLDGALSTLECRVVEKVTGGTHTVFLAEVDRASARAGAPLAYFRGQFGRLELAQDASALRDIRARVLSRDIEVGEPLSLDDLAARVGLPRGPVYHALTKLWSEGLVSGADGAFVVTPLTLEAVDEALRARYAIELGAAALAVGKVPADAFDDLRRCLDATLPERHGQGPFEMGTYLPAYLAFHERVIALAESPALTDAYRRVNAPAMIISMTGARLAESGGDREAATTAFGHHRALVAAYEAGDLEAVNRAIRVHAEFALEVTRRYMNAAGGRI